MNDSANDVPLCSICCVWCNYVVISHNDSDFRASYNPLATSERGLVLRQQEVIAQQDMMISDIGHGVDRLHAQVRLECLLVAMVFALRINAFFTCRRNKLVRK
jgi:hypothetical protein